MTLARSSALPLLLFAVLALRADRAGAQSTRIIDSVRPPITVRSMALDRDGFLWLGGLRSLSRFDGISTSPEDQGLPFDEGPWVIGLASTSKGELYAAIADEVQRALTPGQTDAETFHTPTLLFRRDRRQWVAVAPFDQRRQFTITKMIAVNDGLWIVNEAGLTRVAGGQVTMFDPKGVLGASALTALAATRTGALWVGGRGTLARFDGQNFQRVPAEDLTGPIVDLAVGPDDTLWGADAEDFFHRDADGRQRQAFAAHSLGLKTLLFRTHLLPARDGTLWIGALGGLLQVDGTGQVLARHGAHEGLFDDRVLALWEDRGGGIWAGTRQSGVIRLRPRRVESGSPANPWPTVTAATTIEPDGTVWVAGGEGVFWRDPAGSFVPVPGVASVIDVRGVTPAQPGGIWLATQGQGLQHVTRAGATPVIADGLRPDTRVSLVWNGGTRGLWVGLASGSVLRLEAPTGAALPWRSREFSARDGLCPGVPRNAAPDRGNGLWIAMEGGGLAHIADGRASCPHPGTEHNLARISAVHEDPDGTLWIGRTNDAGLLVKRPQGWFSFAVAQGLFCDTLHEVLDDGRGHLWLLCAGGIQRASKAALLSQAAGQSPMVPVVAFTEADGLLSTETTPQTHPVAALDEEGRLWLASTRGAVLINAFTPETEGKRRVVITSLLINGKAIDHEDPVAVRGRAANVEFRFSIPTLVAPERTPFAYFLEGKDLTWSRGNPLSNQILYTDLGPGRYRLRLLASDGNGNWLPEETRLDFSIVLPLTDRAGFWISVSLVVLALGALFFLARLRRIRARFLVVQSERARIARDLHDLIGQSFTSVGFQLDAARRVARAAGGDPGPLLDTARQTIAQAKKDLRRAIWDLRTERIDVPPLHEALRETVDTHVRRLRGAPPTLALAAVGGSPPRSALHEFEMVQIADESIWNAIKHGQATQVRIELRTGETAVVLRIIDDGVGISDNVASMTKPGHFGIVGMHERAQRIGGTMTIRPAEPSGTEVSVEVPLAEWTGKDP